MFSAIPFRILACMTFFLFLSTSSVGQQVIFCESVDKAGNPTGSSKSFSILPQGSYLNVLVKMPGPAGTPRIVYDLYAVDSLGREKFESSSYLDIQADWTWFNKGFTFYQPGKYALYIYDDKEKLIVAGTLLLVRK